jgi:hypothetical protein
LAFFECNFHSECLMHFRAKVLPDTVVYVHLLPWFSVLDIFMLIDKSWFQIAGGRFDYCLDYEWILDWFLAEEDD